jgi:hypothetical protein
MDWELIGTGRLPPPGAARTFYQWVVHGVDPEFLLWPPPPGLTAPPPDRRYGRASETGSLQTPPSTGESANFQSLSVMTPSLRCSGAIPCSNRSRWAWSAIPDCTIWRSWIRDRSTLQRRVCELLVPKRGFLEPKLKWTPPRKAKVVKDVECGKKTLEETLREYQLTEEEYTAWKRDFDVHGQRGLRTTRVQQYRSTHRPRRR